VAYLRLLGSFYYKRITVTKLVETAGYGRATFYGYFRGIRELRLRLSEYDLAKTEEMLRHAVEMPNASERKSFMLSFMRGHLRYFWPLMTENNIRTHMTAMQQSLNEILKRDFRRRFDGWRFNAEIVEDFYVSGVLRMLVAFYARDNEMTSPATDEELAEFADYALFVTDKNLAERLGL
jgi:AcrR family transcriptional regulator